jgi:hypothetical protein
MSVLDHRSDHRSQNYLNWASNPKGENTMEIEREQNVEEIDFDNSHSLKRVTMTLGLFVLIGLGAIAIVGFVG